MVVNTSQENVYRKLNISMSQYFYTEYVFKHIHRIFKSFKRYFL